MAIITLAGQHEPREEPAEFSGGNTGDLVMTEALSSLDQTTTINREPGELRALAKVPQHKKDMKIAVALRLRQFSSTTGSPNT